MEGCHNFLNLTGYQRKKEKGRELCVHVFVFEINLDVYMK